MTDRYQRFRDEPPLDLTALPDARRWMDVYGELVALWEATIAQFRMEAEQVGSDRARHEIAVVDEVILANRRAHVRRRLRLWEQRVRELEDVEAGARCGPLVAAPSSTFRRTQLEVLSMDQARGPGSDGLGIGRS